LGRLAVDIGGGFLVLGVDEEDEDEDDEDDEEDEGAEPEAERARAVRWPKRCSSF